MLVALEASAGSSVRAGGRIAVTGPHSVPRPSGADPSEVFFHFLRYVLA